MVCLLYLRGMSEKIQRICHSHNRMIYKIQLFEYISPKPSILEKKMTKNFVYSIPCSFGKEYKDKTN